MSYKLLQLSPQTSTRGTSMKIAIEGPWSAPPGNSRDVQFLRSWLEYDSELDEDVAKGRFNWGTISGMALAFVVSAGFWAGVGLIVARIWR